MKESNPRVQLGKLPFYHCTTPAEEFSIFEADDKRLPESFQNILVLGLAICDPFDSLRSLRTSFASREEHCQVDCTLITIQSDLHPITKCCALLICDYRLPQFFKRYRTNRNRRLHFRHRFARVIKGSFVQQAQ